MITKQITSLLLSGAMLIGGAAGTTDCSNAMSMTASAAETNASAYTVNITLMQFHSEGKSMGNEAMKSEAHIVVNADETAQIEIDMQSMLYLGKEGYLGWMKKVTNVVSENRFGYPTEIETEAAMTLEEFTDMYDDFNLPGSEYLDNEVAGKWYPKKLAVPIDFENKEDEILVQVYVPVMESIMTGGGTKFAVLDIDWNSLVKIENVSGDVNNDGAFSVADIIMLQKWLLAVPDTKLANWKAADLYADSKLDVFDLCLMKRALIQNMNTNSNLF